MLRFILRRVVIDPHLNGERSEHLYTLDADVAELEAALLSGGRGDGGCDGTTLVGVEVLNSVKEAL